MCLKYQRNFRFKEEDMPSSAAEVVTMTMHKTFASGIVSK
jgi:hypothetical protein